VIAWRAGGRATRRQRAGASDTETLQTDVMRFVAIIGLCLTAVFALVRSLPAPESAAGSQQRGQTAESTSQQLRQELALVSGELQRLRQEQQTAERALQQARQQVRELAPLSQQLAELYQEREQEQRALEQARGRMRELASRSQQAREDQRAALRELARLEQQMEQQQWLLERARAATVAKPRVEQRRAPVAHPPATGAGSAPERALGPAVPTEAAVQQSRPASVPLAKQHGEPGFVLRFASVAALDRLVRNGTVEFLGIQGQRVWQLSLTQGRPRFINGRKPTRFHEMAADTVPVDYLQAFARVAVPTGVVWGVRLPPVIEGRIGDLTRTAKGGVLVIRDDGQVVLEGNHAG